MNKPIRTVSIFCLLLFLALAAQRDVPAVLPRRARSTTASATAGWPTATFSRERGAILVGRQPRSPRACRVQGPVQVPARSTRSRSCTPRSPAGTPSATRPASSARRTPILSGEDDRLFVNRLVDLVNGNATKGGNVVLTINPAAQTGGVRRAAGARARRPGRRRGDRADHRQDPGDGVAADLRPEQARLPRLQGGRRPTPRSCSKLTSQPLLNRAIQTTLAAGLDVQAGDRARRRCPDRAATPPTRWCRPARRLHAPAVAPTWSTTSVLAAAAATKIPLTQAMECLVQHHASLRSRCAVGRRRDARTGRGVRLQPAPTSTTCPGRRPSRYPAAARPAADRAVRRSARARSPPRPLQMAMVAAGIANDGVVMRPYLVDELQSPDQ